MNMETKKKTCPKCGQEDGSGQNKIHDMNPEHFVKCDIRSIMERDGVCYHCAFWIRMYEQHKNDPNWLIIDGTSYILIHSFLIQITRQDDLWVLVVGRWKPLKILVKR